MCCSPVRRLPRKWLQATLPSWTTRRNQPTSWWSELRANCVVGDSRWTPPSRLVTSERELSMPQKSGVRERQTHTRFSAIKGSSVETRLANNEVGIGRKVHPKRIDLGQGWASVPTG